MVLYYSDQSKPSLFITVVPADGRIHTWLPIQIASHSSCVAFTWYCWRTYACALRFWSGLVRPLICNVDFQVEEGTTMTFLFNSTAVSRTTPNTFANTLKVFTLFPTEDCSCISSKAIVSISHSWTFLIIKLRMVTKRSPTSSCSVVRCPQSLSSPSIKIDHPDTRLAWSRAKSLDIIN